MEATVLGPELAVQTEANLQLESDNTCPEQFNDASIDAIGVIAHLRHEQDDYAVRFDVLVAGDAQFERLAIGGARRKQHEHRHDGCITVAAERENGVLRQARRRLNVPSCKPAAVGFEWLRSMH